MIIQKNGYNKCNISYYNVAFILIIVIGEISKYFIPWIKFFSVLFI